SCLLSPRQRLQPQGFEIQREAKNEGIKEVCKRAQRSALRTWLVLSSERIRRECVFGAKCIQRACVVNIQHVRFKDVT
ncbi:MAG: hypothetical protein Q7U34_01405, partial [Anaerolineales bacterium]|nr:hypothetical protein [Anaerolineales bacterium]